MSLLSPSMHHPRPKELRMNLRYNTPQRACEVSHRSSTRFFAFVALMVTMFALTGSTAWAQLLLEDNFNYAAGNLVGQGGWAQTAAVVTNPVQVAAGSLSATEYASSGIANKVGTLATIGQDVHKSFT